MLALNFDFGCVFFRRLYSHSVYYNSECVFLLRFFRIVREHVTFIMVEQTYAAENIAFNVELDKIKIAAANNIIKCI